MPPQHKNNVSFTYKWSTFKKSPRLLKTFFYPNTSTLVLKIWKILPINPSPSTPSYTIPTHPLYQLQWTKISFCPLQKEPLGQCVSEFLTTVTHGAEGNDWTMLWWWSTRWLPISLKLHVWYLKVTQILSLWFFLKWKIVLSPKIVSKIDIPGRCTLFVLKLVGFLGNIPHHHEVASAAKLSLWPMSTQPGDRS